MSGFQTQPLPTTPSVLCYFGSVGFEFYRPTQPVYQMCYSGIDPSCSLVQYHPPVGDDDVGSVAKTFQNNQGTELSL